MKNAIMFDTLATQLKNQSEIQGFLLEATYVADAEAILLFFTKGMDNKTLVTRRITRGNTIEVDDRQAIEPEEFERVIRIVTNAGISRIKSFETERGVIDGEIFQAAIKMDNIPCHDFCLIDPSEHEHPESAQLVKRLRNLAAKYSRLPPAPE